MQAPSATLHGMRTLFERGHLREIGTPALFAAVVLLLSAMSLLGVNVSMMHHNFDWVQQADDVLQQISAVESGVIGDELSVRGYALTDDPRFLLYQQSNRHNAVDSMNKLRALVADDASQAARFAQLREIVNKHASIFGALTRSGPGHAQEVASAILDRGNRAVMDDMRTQLSSFRTYELRLLSERQAAAAKQVSRTYGIAVGIVVLAFLLGALGLAFMQFGRGKSV